MLDLLRSPGYAVPLLVNLTGSVWFFLLIGKAGEFFFFRLVFAMNGRGDGVGDGEWCCSNGRADLLGF